MHSNHRARTVFASAIVLLILSAFAIHELVSRFSENEGLVAHTYEVQDELRDSNAAVSLVARARLAFIATGEEKYAQAFESGLPDITKTLDRLQALTHDNPKQQELCSQLRKVT
ncbi:MAG TPA: CHASE3 domain-containing protein, partial [Candidatus Angelobacter sp.]